MRHTCLIAAAALLPVTSAGAVTLTFQNGSSSVAGIYSGTEDTYLREASPDACPGKYGTVSAGYEQTGRCRVLLRFDLAALKPLWQSTSRITAARVKLVVSSKTGSDATGGTLQLYRIADANRAWSPGSQVTNTSSEINATCWNYCLFNSTVWPPPGPNAGQPMHQPWAGSKGCGTAGTDYAAAAIATAQVSSAIVGQVVTLAIADPSFLSAWVTDPNANSGFLLKGDAQLESQTVNALLSFASSEHGTTANRPSLELDIDNLGQAAATGISYTLPRASKVSISVFDAKGAEVKKIAVSAQRTAGAQTEAWNCTTDSISYGDVIATVPDGQYTVKILAHQGFTAEYLHNLGLSVPHYERWTGNRGGTSPRAIACIDSSTVFLCGTGFWWGEGCIGPVQVAPDGKRILTYNDNTFSKLHSIAAEYDGGAIYVLNLKSSDGDQSDVWYFPAQATPAAGQSRSGPTMGWTSRTTSIPRAATPP